MPTTTKRGDASGSKSEAELVVDRFFEHWARGDVEAMIGCLADDVRRQNMPMGPTAGAAAVRDLQTAFFDVAEDFRIEVHTQVRSGDVLMLERTDSFHLGGQPVGDADRRRVRGPGRPHRGVA